MSEGPHFIAARVRSIESLFWLCNIRHAVYAEELRYEPLSVMHIEIDAHDPAAAHIALYAEGQIKPVGCARMISIHHPARDLLPKRCPVDWRKTVEISRFCILPEYRCKAATLALIESLKVESWRIGKAAENWVALMSMSLARMLRRYGIRFKKIGDWVEHRGERAVWMLVVKDLPR